MKKKQKKTRPRKSDEVSDQYLFLMSNGLTQELIAEKNKALNAEYLEVKKGKGIMDGEDDTAAYRGYIGHKIAFLQTISEYLVRENEKLQNAVIHLLNKEQQ